MKSPLLHPPPHAGGRLQPDSAHAVRQTTRVGDGALDARNDARPFDPLAGLIDALAARLADRLGVPDELVAVAAEPLEAMGLELAAVRALVTSGRLKAVRIGRRVFTKRSYLLAMVDELPAAVSTPAVPVETHDELQEAVARAAKRKERKSAECRGERASA